jgi:biotin carboxyl carrier protein
VIVDGLGTMQVAETTSRSVVLRDADDTLELLVARYGKVRHVDSAIGPARLEEVDRFPEAETIDDAGSLHAPMPGRVLRIAVAEGETVAEGQPMLVMEAMKMEHTLRAPHTGVVAEVRCRVGDQVEAGETLLVISEI